MTKPIPQPGRPPRNPATPAKASAPPSPEKVDELIDESGRESFPASDPPAHSLPKKTADRQSAVKPSNG